jgi:DNA modification methylase
MNLNIIYTGDALAVLRTFPNKSISCGVTSPPYYGLRDYGVAGQLGREATPEDYVARLVAMFHEFKRVLTDDGTLWVNIGDSYWGQKGASGESSNAYQVSRYTSGVSINRPCSNTGVRGVVGPRQGKHAVIKRKDLIGIPWMLAFAMRADGWYLRQEIIWSKPNPMPESVRDRCTKSHESLFLFTKKEHYYFDGKAILEPAAHDGRKDTLAKISPKYVAGVTGLKVQSFAANAHERWPNIIHAGGLALPARNKRSVWHVPTRSFKGAHFATYPEALITDCVKAGCPPGGVVLDPFMGAGTTAVVARKLGRQYVGIELNPEYVKIANKRLEGVQVF